jgi:uncharacterized cupredoxin-like copper-binding protein
MGAHLSSTRLRAAVAAVVAVGVALAVSACSTEPDGGKSADVINGKQLFVSKCGACHVLARASTKGTTGPNLDQAFQRARKDGEGESTFAGVVRGQIKDPSRLPQFDPVSGKALPKMPANLVTGDDARDVAAYVASAAAVPGKDSGRLASIGAKKAAGTAKESNGVLDIPTDSGGQLAYKFASATATAGQVTIESKNDASIPHDIALEGNGVNEKGEVVQGGGTSKFSIDLKPGSYTFYCSVPGHREAGMEGKLTVK